MAYDLEEQEQLASLKAWWATYGKLILALLAITVVALAGWRGWTGWQASQANKASVLYDELDVAAKANDAGKTKAVQDVLAKDYARTTYAALGALMTSKVQIEAKDLDAAKATLRWVIEKGDVIDAKAIARLRLAGVLLDQKAYDEALTLLNDPPAAFVALYLDRRGDILVAQGKIAEAKKAYEEALGKFASDAGAMRSVVQIKLDALGEG